MAQYRKIVSFLLMSCLLLVLPVKAEAVDLLQKEYLDEAAKIQKNILSFRDNDERGEDFWLKYMNIAKSHGIVISDFSKQTLTKQKSELYGQRSALMKEIADYQENSKKILPFITKTLEPNGRYYKGFYYQDGDIVVAKSAVANISLGHAGIVSDGDIIEINLFYNHGHPRTLPLEEWLECYPDQLVLRQNDGRKEALKAAWYAKNHFIKGDGKENNYNLVSTLDDQEKDYCSALVWKCFRFGAGRSFSVKVDNKWSIPAIYAPYDYVIYREYNQLQAVHQINW